MNNIKTYEAFFSRSFNRIEDKDLIKLIGIDIQTLEDLLVDFEDKMPWVHISIDFLNFGSSYILPIRSMSWVYNDPYDHNSYPIRNLLLSIKFYPSKNHMEELKKNIKAGDEWYNLIVGDIDLSDEVETLKKRLELLGFYNVRPSRVSLKAEPLIGDVHVSRGIYHGKYFFEIDAIKDTISK